MPRDEESRRARNAKRLLWVVLLGALLLAAFIAYTSLNAPDREAMPPKGTAPLQR
ncbi:MAG TPA: hypothetical protein VJQ78_06235 [Sphingobium sp.]|nr:hypothetical protein [Sphingobium sp.]